MQRTIDPQTMTLYAELLDQMQMLDASRTTSSLKGSFSFKTIKGEEYVYFDHYTLGGRHQQTYIGTGPGQRAGTSAIRPAQTHCFPSEGHFKACEG